MLSQRKNRRRSFLTTRCCFCHNRGHTVETCQHKIKKDKKILQKIDSLDYEELMRDIMIEISSQYTDT